MTTKWDELVEVAAIAGAIMPTWKALTEMERKARRIEMDTALRALLANGIEFVPGEVTPAIEQAHFDAHAVAATFFAEMPDLWRAMLSAGSIKPEGE